MLFRIRWFGCYELRRIALFLSLFLSVILVFGSLVCCGCLFAGVICCWFDAAACGLIVLIFALLFSFVGVCVWCLFCGAVGVLV